MDSKFRIFSAISFDYENSKVKAGLVIESDEVNIRKEFSLVTHLKDYQLFSPILFGFLETKGTKFEFKILSMNFYHLFMRSVTELYYL